MGISHVRVEPGETDRTYVCGGVLLVGGNDGAATLGSVERTLSLDGGLTVGTRATGLAADLGDGVPVAHFEGVVELVGGVVPGIEVGCSVA